MLINRDAIIAASLIIAVGLMGYFMAANERALENCMKIQSEDVCRQVIK